MKRYINIKSVHGTETIDELEQKDFSSYREFIKELRRLIHEYRLAGMDVYTSQRCTLEWRS